MYVSFFKSEMEFLSASEMLGRIYDAVCVQTGRKKAPSDAKYELRNLGKLIRKRLREWWRAKRIEYIKEIFWFSHNNNGEIIFHNIEKQLFISIWNKTMTLTRYTRIREILFADVTTIRNDSLPSRICFARFVHKIRDAESMETSRASVLKLSFSLTADRDRYPNIRLSFLL